MIISQFGLMFFTDNAEAFANLARACRAGGRLIGIVWPTRDKISMFSYLFSSVRQTLDRLRIPYQEPPLDFGPFSLGDPRYVGWLLRQRLDRRTGRASRATHDHGGDAHIFRPTVDS